MILTDAVLHDRAQRLRHELAEELLQVEKLYTLNHFAEPTHDAGQIAAFLLGLGVAGNRKGLGALGIEIPGDGPVPDEDLRAAIRSAAHPPEFKRAARRRQEE